MRLETPRLLIRNFTVEDFPDLWEILSDPRAMEHFVPMEAGEAREVPNRMIPIREKRCFSPVHPTKCESVLHRLDALA